MLDLARQFLRFELVEARQELVLVDDVTVVFQAVDTRLLKLADRSAAINEN